MKFRERPRPQKDDESLDNQSPLEKQLESYDKENTTHKTYQISPTNVENLRCFYCRDKFSQEKDKLMSEILEIRGKSIAENESTYIHEECVEELKTPKRKKQGITYVIKHLELPYELFKDIAQSQSELEDAQDQSDNTSLQEYNKQLEERVEKYSKHFRSLQQSQEQGLSFLDKCHKAFAYSVALPYMGFHHFMHQLNEPYLKNKQEGEKTEDDPAGCNFFLLLATHLGPIFMFPKAAAPFVFTYVVFSSVASGYWFDKEKKFEKKKKQLPLEDKPRIEKIET